MKVLLLVLILISSVFADRKIISAHINGEVKTVEVISQKVFYYRCIDGYRWIQFATVSNYGDINNAAVIIEEGLPIQMFRDDTMKSITVPVSCN